MTRLFLLFCMMFAQAGCIFEPAKPTPKPKPAKVETVKVLDFTADWCGPCRKSAPAINRLEKAGWKIVRIDIDERADLASKWKITAVPTYIVLKGNKEVTRTHDVDELRAALKQVR